MILQLWMAHLQFQPNNNQSRYVSTEVPNLWLSATWKPGAMLLVGKSPYNLRHTHNQHNVIPCNKLLFVLLNPYGIGFKQI